MLLTAFKNAQLFKFAFKRTCWDSLARPKYSSTHVKYLMPVDRSLNLNKHKHLICSCSFGGKGLSSPILLLVHKQHIDYWQIYGFSQLEHSLHSNCEGKPSILSACSVGESKWPFSSSCVRVFFALSHCSKVILKFINKTKRRYSIVWEPESVKHWIDLKPKTRSKRRQISVPIKEIQLKMVLNWGIYL